jgi:hypothetical protein
VAFDGSKRIEVSQPRKSARNSKLLETKPGRRTSHLILSWWSCYVLMFTGVGWGMRLTKCWDTGTMRKSYQEESREKFTARGARPRRSSERVPPSPRCSFLSARLFNSQKAARRLA